MTQKERNIYSELYDICFDNLKAYGIEEMTTKKETLLASLDLMPDTTDISLVYDVPGNDFVQALFYITFDRWAQPDETQKIKDDSLSERDFKGKVLRMVYESNERRIKNKVITNFIDYSGQYSVRVGKLKRRIRITKTKIVARIPLMWKVAIKGFINGLFGRKQ